MRRFPPRLWRLLLALPLLALVGCSVQEIALIPIAVIRGRIEVPEDMRAVTIRVSRVGTTSERVPVTAESTFTDVEGDFLLETNHLGGGFVVANGIEYDITFSPIFLEEYGETVSVDAWLPSTGPMMIPKTPGSSLFLVFEEDFTPDFGPIQRVDLVGPDCFELDGCPGDTADDLQLPIPLHDDGSQVDIDPLTPGMQVSGDLAAGDKVWTVRVGADRFPAGEQQYGFFVNENTVLGFQRDPYEEGEDDDHSVILVK